MGSGPEAPEPDRGAARRGPLRTALGGLTTRGRSFLAAGTAAALCAYALGQADLLRVGMLLIALPLVCTAVLHRPRHQPTGSRHLSPVRVPTGAEARVHLRLDNTSRLSTGPLMLEDRVPHSLGPGPRFVLEQVEPGGRREVSYRVLSDLRGRYVLGPLQLRLADPFGMAELTCSVTACDTLTVVPPTEPLPPVRPAGGSTGWGGGGRYSPAAAGEDDMVPRSYRRGDDLRRVHWRSTARRGELMVRREERPRRPCSAVLLDTRRSAWTGSGPGSAFEWAVAGAASVAVHLLERGHAVRLLTDTGTSVPGPGPGPDGGASDTAGLLLEALAVVGHSAGTGLARAYEALRSGGGGGAGLLVAFLGALDDEQAALVGRMRRHAGGAVALVARGQRDPEVEEGRLRMLREAGWTVLPYAPGDALPELWRGADRMEGGAAAVDRGGVR